MGGNQHQPSSRRPLTPWAWRGSARGTPSKSMAQFRVRVEKPSDELKGTNDGIHEETRNGPYVGRTDEQTGVDTREGHLRILEADGIKSTTLTPSSWIDSPVASCAFVLVAIVLIVALLLSSSERRLRPRLAVGRRTWVDEEEVEIVEFYEAERIFEENCGILNMEDRGQITHGEPVDLSPDFKSRDIRVDSVCSTVWHDIEAIDVGEDAKLEHNMDRNEPLHGTRCEQELNTCIHDSHGTHGKNTQHHVLSNKTGGGLMSQNEEINDDCNNETHGNTQHHLPSESSSTLTTSSLASEMMYPDIEESFCQPHDDSIAPSYSVLVTNRMLIGSSVTTSKTDSELTTSNTAVMNNQAKDKFGDPRERRVSFSPEVIVREIPRESSSSTSSKIIYVMLVVVGITIVVCSFRPMSSSLSPRSSISRRDLLRHQWDYEL